MSSRKLLILTGVVVALFAFIFFIERKLPTTSEREQKGDLYWDLPEDQVDSIVLERGAETVEFARTGDSWRLRKPEAYAADSFAVSDLATALADLKKPPTGEATTEGNGEAYGLAKPSAKATFAWKDPKKEGKKQSRTLEFGLDIPGTDLSAARVAGSTEILFVPASLAASVRKPVDDFKSKDVFGGSSSDVAAIDVVRGRGRFTLAKKNGVWWLEQPIADLADRDAADRLANDIAALRVTEFVPRAQSADLAALGLSPPIYRVTLTDSKSAKRSLDLGSTRSDGNDVYAAHEGQVFTLSNSLLDDLSKEAVAFRDKRLVRFERSDVQGITAAADGKRRVFARQQAGWSADGRPVLASATDDLMTAILDAESTSFLDDASVGALAARRPELEIEVRMAAGPPWRVTLHPLRGEFAAIVSRRPGGFALARPTAEKLKAAIEKAAATPPPTPGKTPTKK
jgi:hypothetical protein